MSVCLSLKGDKERVQFDNVGQGGYIFPAVITACTGHGTYFVQLVLSM